MRADNDGEGGILALIALVAAAANAHRQAGASDADRARHVRRRRSSTATAMITPAISVLSAVEGLKVVDAQPRSHRGPDHDRRSGRAVRDPALRHRSGRPPVRPGDGGLVRGDRRRRSRPRSRSTRPSSRRSRRATGSRSSAAHADAVLRRARRDRADDHRRRGALRRHGPLRPAADHAAPGSASSSPR